MLDKASLKINVLNYFTKHKRSCIIATRSNNQGLNKMTKAAQIPVTETPEFLELLKQWSETRQQAAVLAAKENELRLAVYSKAFPQLEADNNAKGTFNVPLPNNWKLKTEAKFNASVDAEVLSTMRDNLLLVQKIPVDTVFKYKPDLSLTGYNALSDEQKKSLADIVTFKRAKPTLELVPPKTEKAKM